MSTNPFADPAEDSNLPQESDSPFNGTPSTGKVILAFILGIVVIALILALVIGLVNKVKGTDSPEDVPSVVASEEPYPTLDPTSEPTPTPTSEPTPTNSEPAPSAIAPTPDPVSPVSPAIPTTPEVAIPNLTQTYDVQGIVISKKVLAPTSPTNQHVYVVVVSVPGEVESRSVDVYLTRSAFDQINQSDVVKMNIGMDSTGYISVNSITK